jgi:hypothetical protein
MTHNSPRANRFILEAFDCDLWCPIAQVLLHVTDIGSLRSILGAASHEDLELRHTYHLDDEDLAALAARFGVELDRSRLEAANLVIRLLLDGRKKLARMLVGYPPMTFDGEDRFDHWVAEGLLHREEVLEPFDSPVRGYLGNRTIYYTLKGEEWRIPASKLIWEASSKAGGWNEYFERLEGMLYGYEDWQNDWWIDTWLQNGGFGGPRFCCAVTSAGLAWIEAAGFRALPPVEGSVLMIAGYDVDAKAECLALMLKNPDHAAVVGFTVLGRYVRKLIEPEQRGPWRVQAEQIGELNKHLWGLVVIVGRRHDLVPSERV